MTDNIMAITTGRLSLSRITYHTNLQQASGLIVPLGVMVELTLGHWRALGLIARTELSMDETKAVGRLIREKIARPFDFLKPEFDWAFSKTTSGYALAELANRFSESLFFAPPTAHAIRKVLPPGAAAAEPILGDLRKARDEEFYLMLAELEDQRPMPIEATTKLAA